MRGQFRQLHIVLQLFQDLDMIFVGFIAQQEPGFVLLFLAEVLGILETQVQHFLTVARNGYRYLHFVYRIHREGHDQLFGLGMKFGTQESHGIGQHFFGRLFQLAFHLDALAVDDLALRHHHIVYKGFIFVGNNTGHIRIDQVAADHGRLALVALQGLYLYFQQLCRLEIEVAHMLVHFLFQCVQNRSQVAFYQLPDGVYTRFIGRFALVPFAGAVTITEVVFQTNLKFAFFNTGRCKVEPAGT